MFLIYGKRKARIKNYEDNTRQCPNCKSLNMQASVYKTYFHVFYIPFFPTGVKSSKLWCHDCGSLIRIDSLQTEYEKKTRVPFYLYSGLILIALLISFVVYANIETQKEKKLFVQNPQVGDVYLIREDRKSKQAYYFLKITSVKRDSVTTFHSNLEYSGFISEMQAGDFFVEDEELYYTKGELLEMLDKGEINSVKR